MMDTLIKIYDAWAGPLFAISFFGIVGYIFYWIIVIAPRKIRRLFGELKSIGYQDVDLEESTLRDVISRIVAVYPVRPRKDQETPPWNIRNAIRRKEGQDEKIVAHVTRLQIDQPGVGRGTSRATILFLEKRRLYVNDEIHITPKGNHGNNLWEERYKSSIVTEGYGERFLDCYTVYSPSSTPSPLPSELCDTLIEICPSICQKEFFFLQGGINFRFSPEGWGITPANIIYKKMELTMMMEIFDRISGTLR
jgi:hypothetical protein